MQVFTSMALFNTLIGPLNSLPWVVNGLVEAAVSLRRLELYLATPQVTSQGRGYTCIDSIS